VQPAPGQISSSELHAKAAKPDANCGPKRIWVRSLSDDGTKSGPDSTSDLGRSLQSLTMMQPPATPQIVAPQSAVPQSDSAQAAFSGESVLPLQERPLQDSDRRLRKHADYQRAYKATRKQFSSSMSWFLAVRSSIPDAMASSSCPRVGLTVGKVIGKAHERNLIKRRMREAVRHAIHELPEGVDLILHPKRSVMTMDFVKLEAEVLRIFRQAASQTQESAAKAAQTKPVMGPEAVQKPERVQKRAATQSSGESVTRS
jgi:ribonuclease P protein component